MNYKIMIFGFILIFSNFSSILSQQFNIGLKSETFYLMSKINSESENKFYVTSFYALGGLKINPLIQIEAEYGILLSEGHRFNGVEICLIGKYFINDGKDYITAGYVFHKNKGENSSSHQSVDNNLSLATIGIGTYLSKIFFTQFSYQFPLGDNHYANDLFWDFKNGLYTKNPLWLKGLLKFSMGISFDI